MVEPLVCGSKPHENLGAKVLQSTAQPRGDGVMDRWVAYREGRRHEVWEAAAGGGPSDLHLVYDDDGEALVRIELDGDGDGRMDRVFVYEAGRLAAERRDTSGDGRFDDVQHYDSEGLIRLREEDVDSDGRVDVRTAYSRGRIVRREIMSPDSSVRIQ